MGQTEKCHRCRKRGPVAVDLRCHAAQQNPPSIYRLVKLALHLLCLALPGRGGHDAVAFFIAITVRSNYFMLAPSVARSVPSIPAIENSNFRGEQQNGSLTCTKSPSLP